MAKRMTRAEELVRQQKALQMIMAGYTYEDVAATLEYSDRSSAYRSVKRLLDRYEKEVVNDYRNIIGNRLEELFAAWWPTALGQGPTHTMNPHKQQLEASKLVLGVMKEMAGMFLSKQPTMKEDETDPITVIYDIPKEVPEEWLQEQERLLRASLPKLTGSSSPTSGEQPTP